MYRGVQTVYSFVCDLSSFPRQNHVTPNDCHRKGKVKEHHPTQDPKLFQIALGNTEYILQCPRKKIVVHSISRMVRRWFPCNFQVSHCSIFLVDAIWIYMVVSENRGTPKSSISRWDFPWNKPSILGYPVVSILLFYVVFGFFHDFHDLILTAEEGDIESLEEVRSGFRSKGDRGCPWKSVLFQSDRGSSAGINENSQVFWKRGFSQNGYFKQGEDNQQWDRGDSSLRQSDKAIPVYLPF